MQTRPLSQQLFSLIYTGSNVASRSLAITHQGRWQELPLQIIPVSLPLSVFALLVPFAAICVVFCCNLCSLSAILQRHNDTDNK